MSRLTSSALPSAEENVAGEVYAHFYTYCPALDQFSASFLNRGLYPAKTLKANLKRLQRAPYNEFSLDFARQNLEDARRLKAPRRLVEALERTVERGIPGHGWRALNWLRSSMARRLPHW